MRTKEPKRNHKEGENLNRREEVFKRPGWYLIVTPPLHNGLCFSVLYNPLGEETAKATRLLSGEARQKFARAYIDGLKNEK